MGVCARCGAQNDGGSVFCPGCGAVQTPTGQTSQPEQPPYGQYGQPGPYGQPGQYHPYGGPDPYGQTGQQPPAVGYGAPTWGTPPPPPPAPPPPGGWTSQAGATGQWEHPGTYATAPVGPPPQRPRDPKLLMLVLGVVGLVVVAGVIAFLLLSRHGSTSSNASASATTSSAAPSTRQAPSSSASASPTGGVRSVVGTPEAAPSSTSGAQLPLAAARADCTYPPSVDGKNQPVTYEAGKAVDADPTTAWRCPGAGGHTIELRGAGSTSDLGLIPGYAKVDPATGVNRFTDNHTVTQVVWRLQQGPNTVQVLQDIPNPTPQMTWVHLPGNYAFDSISVTVTGTGNPGARQDSTPISTIAVWGSTSTPGN